MPIDKNLFSERLLQISERNQQKPVRDGRGYTIEKKLEVVGQWLLLGNMKLVAGMTGVDYDLIRKWKGQPWWPEMVKELRATQNIEMDTKLSDVIQKSLDATYDRIVNGDFIYDQKTGKILRKPVNMRDAARVASDLLSRRELLRDKFEAKGEDKALSVEEHLKMLANNMSKWFESKNQPIIELEEVEDAVYAERETGLQEGERPLQQPPGECEEAGGEEQSPPGIDEDGSGT